MNISLAICQLETHRVSSTFDMPVRYHKYSPYLHERAVLATLFLLPPTLSLLRSFLTLLLSSRLSLFPLLSNFGIQGRKSLGVLISWSIRHFSAHSETTLLRISLAFTTYLAVYTSLFSQLAIECMQSPPRVLKRVGEKTAYYYLVATSRGQVHLWHSRFLVMDPACRFSSSLLEVDLQARRMTYLFVQRTVFFLLLYPDNARFLRVKQRFRGLFSDLD